MWYRLLTWSQVAAAGLLSFTAFAAQYQIAVADTNIWHDFVLGFKDEANYIVALSNFVLWTAHAIKRYLGNPWAWETIKSLLGELKTDVFRGQSNVTAHLDRVTLFKKVDCRFRFGLFPSSDWLVAVERSGHMNRRKRKWLRAKDDGKTFDGVAGATWCHGRTMLVEELPELKNHSTHSLIKTYAEKSFMSEAYVRRRLADGYKFPRSLCGIIVEVDDSPWGVIVIDSQFEKLVTIEEIEGFYKKNAKSLAKLLAVL